MNYEDRTDLLPPDAVVGSEVLERLRSNESDPLGCLDQVADTHELDDVAHAVIGRFIALEDASGAPGPACQAEQDAAECGYVFGRLLLGPARGDLSSEQVWYDVDRMDLYALVNLIDEGTPSFTARLSAYLAHRARLVPGTEDLSGALEEAMPLAWCIGLGAAVVLADCR